MFQTGKIEHLACPVFRGGCEVVASSPVAYPRGIPDAIFGVIGYAAAATTALAIPRTRGKTRKTLAAVAVAGSIGALGISAFLTYAQPTFAGAWCFWCLTSAFISSTMALSAIYGASAILKDSQGELTHERLSGT
jgi:uncharacterized membrane protein